MKLAFKTAFYTLAAIEFLFWLQGCIAHAQTNQLVNVTNSVPQELPDSTAADWAKALGDLGFHISAAQISLIILIGLPFVKALSGYLRKAIPKQMQVNKAGILLAHVAGVDNPTLASLASEIPKPQAAETATSIKAAELLNTPSLPPTPIAAQPPKE